MPLFTREHYSIHTQLSGKHSPGADCRRQLDLDLESAAPEDRRSSSTQTGSISFDLGTERMALD